MEFSLPVREMPKFVIDDNEDGTAAWRSLVPLMPGICVIAFGRVAIVHSATFEVYSS
jgi:hypothetical protein